MPKIYKYRGWIIFFWSNEGEPLECIHIHVDKKIHKNATKYWILENGSVELEHNKSKIPKKDLYLIEKSLVIFHDEIVEAWRNFFGAEPKFKG